MSRNELGFVVIVMAASCLIHELGHLIAGLLVGYEVNSFYISLYQMGIRWEGVLNPTSTFIVLLAGGVAQGIFLLYMSRYHKAFLIGAAFFFVYALFEAGVL